METFTTEEQAKSQLRLQISIDEAENAPSSFCPLAREICRNDCVCYVEPHIESWGDQWYVQEGYCGNGMFEERPTLQI